MLIFDNYLSFTPDNMNKKTILQIFLAVFISSSAAAQLDSTAIKDVIPDSSKKNFNLFGNEDLLEITLRFDLSTYWRTKPKIDYLKANITFHISDTDSVSSDIRLRTRGEYRNQNCYFAPIELNFKKADFGYKDLNKIGKIKLVPECRTGSENRDYIFREYLIYKLFNVLTDTSFRVRLLKINYIDSEKKRKPVSQYGFFIEPLDMLTKRTNTIEVKAVNLTQKDIYPFVIDRLAIFNYMIGNYDWGVPKQHNVKIIKPLVVDPRGLAFAIPYDFDWTGLVNASYAIPGDVVGISSIRERLFVGICRSREVYRKDLETFIDKKDEFYRVIDEFPYLDKRNKKDMSLYLDEFYRDLSGKMRIIDVFLNSCKKL